LSRDEQIVRTNGLALPLQIGANSRCGFRRRAVQRKFVDGGNESLDFLSLLGRLVGFLDAAEQFIDADHGDGAIGGRKLDQPLHHAGSLPQHADAGVGVEQARHGRLQVFNRRQLPLLWTLERGVSDMDGIEETFGPGFRLRRLKHNSVAVLTDENGRRQVNAFRQADGLTVAFGGDGCCFHAGELNRNSGQNQASSSEEERKNYLVGRELTLDILPGRNFEGDPDLFVEAVVTPKIWLRLRAALEITGLTNEFAKLNVVQDYTRATTL